MSNIYNLKVIYQVQVCSLAAVYFALHTLIEIVWKV